MNSATKENENKNTEQDEENLQQNAEFSDGF
jgi:hypothetical protein